MIGFVLGWALIGIITQGIFMYGMKRKYPEYGYDWDIFPLQLIMSMIAGPVGLFALSVVFGSSKDEDDDR